MDYRIKFEYKGIGRQAAGIRQKAIQASQARAAATGTQPGVSLSNARESVTILRKLDSSIQKLIASNNNLIRSMGGKPGPGGGGGGPGVTSPGIGGIGASIPILGAAIATAGFTIQKINQIGTAYIQKVQEQLSTAGIGGFRRVGAGIYTAGQISAGMKAYGMGMGRFARGRPNQAALNVGAIYGLSAEETLGVAGRIKRAGGNYAQMANIGAGMGIQAELPILLSGIADTLTEAVKQGINTSDMSKDMARDLAAITMKMPGQSVEAALSVMRNFQGVRGQVTGGKIQSAQGLFATKAAQSMLMERITGAGGGAYVENLRKTGFLTDEQASKMQGIIYKGGTWEDLLQKTPGAAFPLLRKFTAETSPVALQQRTLKTTAARFGNTPQGRQRFYDFALSQGWAENQSQIEAMLTGKNMPVAGAETRGTKELAKQAQTVQGGAVGMGVRQIRQREELIFKYGESFGEASIKMEKALINLADRGAKYATDAIAGLGDTVTKVSETMKNLMKVIQTYQKKGAIPMLWDYITN